MAMSGLMHSTRGGKAAGGKRHLRDQGMLVAREEDEAFFHARLGADLYRRGLYAQAGMEFRRALASNPNWAGLHNQLAITLNAQGLYEDAIGELRQALDINPAFSEARTNLALTLRAAGREEQAASATLPTPPEASGHPRPVV